MADHVLFIDDEPAMRQAVRQWLELIDCKVSVFDRPGPAMDLAGSDFPGILLTDVKMAGMNGLEVLDKVRERDPELPVILVTGHGDVTMAVEAMRKGAYDFIEKPFDPERLGDAVRRALEKRRLTIENRSLRSTIAAASGIEARLIGTSAVMEALRRQVAELAATDVNVVILGETGVGKEVVARCLHDHSPRKSRPFVAVNCAAIPETIFESEFFGHEAGAFTGALRRKIGKLEYAHRGSLFMDEIESMPLHLQAKVLRSFQERTVERLAGHDSIPADVRVISAAKIDLFAAARAGRFREDLYYRLNVAELRIPPLRERREDIPLLFAHFAAESARRQGRDPAETGGRPDFAALCRHDWPGNVRELRNAAERHVLGLSMPSAWPPQAAESSSATGLAGQVAECERRAILTAFEQAKGDVQAVMSALDLPRRTLNEKMVRYGIDRRKYTKRE
jgi:two-component system C4-dicarboxylate transport response regulator DctD